MLILICNCNFDWILITISLAMIYLQRHVVVIQTTFLCQLLFFFYWFWNHTSSLAIRTVPWLWSSGNNNLRLFNSAWFLKHCICGLKLWAFFFFLIWPLYIISCLPGLFIMYLFTIFLYGHELSRFLTLFLCFI